MFHNNILKIPPILKWDKSFGNNHYLSNSWLHIPMFELIFSWFRIRQFSSHLFNICIGTIRCRLMIWLQVWSIKCNWDGIVVVGFKVCWYHHSLSISQGSTLNEPLSESPIKSGFIIWRKLRPSFASTKVRKWK